ncbi:MAG: response regulator [Cyanobacteria bacterium P01_E01_bin.48]
MSSLKVLLVDDNRVGQKVGQRLLSSLGYKADIAGNGQEALELCARNTYGLILMDCQMPVMDGYRATRVLRQQTHPQPIVIALTADNLAEQKDKCMEAGMDDYLTKPITRDILKAAIARWQDEMPMSAQA